MLLHGRTPKLANESPQTKAKNNGAGAVAGSNGITEGKYEEKQWNNLGNLMVHLSVVRHEAAL